MENRHETGCFSARPRGPFLSYFFLRPPQTEQKQSVINKGNKREMKTLVIRTIQLLALLIALAVPAFAEESKRGFYEGDLAGGGKIVFFVQGNHAISAYFFDVAGVQSGFAGGGAGNDGKFTLHGSSHQTITGTIGTNSITAT